MIENDAAKQVELLELVREFIKDNRITCPETIYQCDFLIENACEFIEQICEIVGYSEETEE